MILPLPTHPQARFNTPSVFLVCKVRDLLDSEAGGNALSSCSFNLHLVEGTPDDGAADTTPDRVHGRRSFWREPKKKLRLLVEHRRLQRWINGEVHVLHCSPSCK